MRSSTSAIASMNRTGCRESKEVYLLQRQPRFRSFLLRGRRRPARRNGASLDLVELSLSRMELAVRKLCVQMSMSLDGFVAGPKGELAWQFANQDESAEAWALDRAWQAGAHLMGSHTYHDMAGWWPSSTELFAPAMNQIPKVVFSKDLEVTSRTKWTPVKTTSDSAIMPPGPPRATAAVSVANEKSWVDARVMSGDLVKDIAQLKSEPGKDLIAWGGAGFCRSLTRLGLVDTFALTVYPVVIGQGLSIFSEVPETMTLQLDSGTTFSKGVVAHVYRMKPKPN